MLLRDPMFFVVCLAALVVVLVVRHEATRLANAICSSGLALRDGFTHDAQAISQAVARCESMLRDARSMPRERNAGMLLVLGTVRQPNGELVQFCSGRSYRLNDGERGEFAETMHAELMPGTIVIAIGNLAIDGVFANQRSFVPWSGTNAAPVTIVPEAITVGAQLRVGVRGHAW